MTSRWATRLSHQPPGPPFLTASHRLPNAWQVLFEWGGLGSQPGQFNTPKGMCLLRSAVYVADSANNRISVFTARRGALVRVFGREGTAAGEFRSPCGLAACPLGSKISGSKFALLVAESGGKRVQLLTPTGEPLHVLPLPGAQMLSGASFLISRREVYVTDEKAGHVYVLSVRHIDKSVKMDDREAGYRMRGANPVVTCAALC